MVASEFLLVDLAGNVEPMDNQSLVTSKIALLYGAQNSPGTGLLKMRTDAHGGRDWNSHATSMRLLEANISKNIALVGEWNNAVRNDDFAATLGGLSANQLVHEFKTAMEEALPDLAGLRVFHQNTSIPPGAREYRQFRTWRTGKAIVYGGGDGSDATPVSIGQTDFQAPIRYLISRAQVDWLERLSGQFAGVDNVASHTATMRRVIAELEDEWTFLGSTDYGIRGLLNHPYMESALSTVPYTSASTGDAITEDFGVWANYAALNSKGTFESDTLLIARKLVVPLRQRGFGDDRNKSLFDWMMAANPHLKRIEVVDRLNDAGGPGIHAMAFVKGQGGPAQVSIEVMKVMQETLLPPDVKPLITEFFTVSATGGINQRHAGNNLVVFVQGVE